MNMRRRLTAGIIVALSASSVGLVSIDAGNGGNRCIV
jgi:hypothetical protein